MHLYKGTSTVLERGKKSSNFWPPSPSPYSLAPNPSHHLFLSPPLTFRPSIRFLVAPEEGGHLTNLAPPSFPSSPRFGMGCACLAATVDFVLFSKSRPRTTVLYFHLNRGGGGQTSPKEEKGKPIRLITFSRLFPFLFFSPQKQFFDAFLCFFSRSLFFIFCSRFPPPPPSFWLPFFFYFQKLFFAGRPLVMGEPEHVFLFPKTG